MKLNKKKLFVALFFFGLIFTLIGLPHKNWWFSADDLDTTIPHGIYNKTLNDLMSHFKNEDINRFWYPSNHPKYSPPQEASKTHENFFTVYYRPLLGTMYALLNWTVGTNGYYLFLFMVLIHALNALLLFYILLFFLGIFPAFLTSLFFAFHPITGFYFGPPAYLHYYISTTFILGTFLFLKKYLDSKNLFFYFASCFLYLLALFTRELGLILPAILTPGIYLYQKGNTSYSLKTFICSLPKIAFLLTGYLIGFITYLVMRLSAFPLPQTTTGTSTFISFLKKLPLRYYEGVAFLYDFFTLSWLPWGNKIIRASFLFGLIFLMIFIFIKCSKRLLVLYLLCSMTLLLWPAIIGYYHPRYFYEAMPFAFLAIAICIAYHQGPLLKYKKIFLLFLTILIPFYMTHTMVNLHRREQKLHCIEVAVKKFVQDNKLGDRPLCFLCLPYDGLASGIEQAIWSERGGKNDPPIYYDQSLLMYQAESHFFVSNGWVTLCSNYINKNYFSIIPIYGGFKFIINDPHQLNFCYNNDHAFCIGKKNTIKETMRNNQKVVTEFDLLIDQKYLNNNPLFVSWDYEKKEFVIVNSL